MVVTGHSLGAGAAALVALYLRNFFPTTRAWAFAPPGGLVDTALADAAASCVTSVAVGKDWVRLHIPGRICAHQCSAPCLGAQQCRSLLRHQHRRGQRLGAPARGIHS